MNKRGEIPWVTVSLVVIILSGFVLGFFLYSIADANNKQGLTDRELCKDHFLLASNSRAGGLIDFSDISSNCETQTPFVDSSDEKEIMERIAEEAYWCWWQTQAGDPTGWRWVGSKSYCLACSIVDFGDKSKELGEIDVQDFLNYLDDNSFETQIRDDIELISYHDYFYKKQYEGRSEEVASANQKIDLSESLMIMWILEEGNGDITKHVKDELDESFYGKGLKVSFGNTLDTKDDDIVRTVFAYQNPQDNLDPRFGLCDEVY